MNWTQDTFKTRDGRTATVEMARITVPLFHGTSEGSADLAVVRFPRRADRGHVGDSRGRPPIASSRDPGGNLATASRHAPGGGAGDSGGDVPGVSLPGGPGGAVGPGQDIPIVFLSGGPGESALAAAAGRLYDTLDALRRVGDVVVFDQRGCGRSAPAIDALRAWEMPFDEPVVRDALLQTALDVSASTARELRRDGPPPEAFQTMESARDVLHLIDFLGARRVHLVAASYGTHLAMAVLRMAPDRVARVVLAGPEGPDHTLKLPSVVSRQLDRLGEAAGVNAFVDRVRGVLVRLEKEPVVVEPAACTPAGASGENAAGKMVVGRFDIEWLTATGLADTRVLSVLPLLYASLERNDANVLNRSALLQRYLIHLRRGLGRNAMGLCMDCASGASEPRLRRIEREAKQCVLNRTIDFPFPEIRSAWNVPDLGDAFRSPLVCDNPALFITGEWDCRTPHENAEELLEGFCEGVHLRVRGAGHSDLLIGDAVASCVARFLGGDDLPDRSVEGPAPPQL